jgi:hypothetical protein
VERDAVRLSRKLGFQGRIFLEKILSLASSTSQEKNKGN